MIDRLKLSHHYTDAYHEPNDLWTPDEITEAGFIFVLYPTFIHDFSNPMKPIMKSYVGGFNGEDEESFPLPIDNYKSMLVRSSRYCGVNYIKTYDLDVGRLRGMESVSDYYRKKDIFKPMILEWMKKMEYHYVYRVSLEDSPISWMGKFGDSYMIHHMHALNVRGCRLPVKL
jgi:hypothetical protein